jgi:hypothetical protein
MISSSSPTIERKAYPWGRAYIVKGVSEAPLILPSVTTVLKLVVIQKYIEMREELGEEKYQKVLDDAAFRGTIMHNMLEIFILEWARSKNIDRALKKAQIYAIDESRKEDGKYAKLVEKGRKLFFNFYHDKFWERISEVVENEIFLYTIFKGGWAGASDFVYRDLEGNLIVEDFKSAAFAKTEEEIRAYYLQIAAYMFMCGEKYNEIPKKGIIRIANENDDELQTFIVHDYELKHHLSQFIELVQEFRKINNL